MDEREDALRPIWNENKFLLLLFVFKYIFLGKQLKKKRLGKLLLDL